MKSKELKQADNQATEKPTKQKAAKLPKLTRKEKDAIMESMGLTKVRGAVSGKIYYE